MIYALLKSCNVMPYRSLKSGVVQSQRLVLSCRVVLCLSVSSRLSVLFVRVLLCLTVLLSLCRSCLRVMLVFVLSFFVFLCGEVSVRRLFLCREVVSVFIETNHNEIAKIKRPVRTEFNAVLSKLEPLLDNVLADFY
jgi:hypothetical protein